MRNKKESEQAAWDILFLATVQQLSKFCVLEPRNQTAAGWERWREAYNKLFDLERGLLQRLS